MIKQMKKDPLDKKEPENTLLVHETYGKAVGEGSAAIAWLL